MNKLMGENKTMGNESRVLSILLQAVPGIFGGFIEFFTLSDEEIIQAGINVGNHKYEEPITACLTKM